MDKYQQATIFYNKYVRLNDSKKEEFSRLTNKYFIIVKKILLSKDARNIFA